jgi:prevent-host-death family protein
MVDVSEPDAHLAELVAIATSGTQVIVTRSGKAAARLVPVETNPKYRIPDLRPGAIQPSDDFDSPLPDEIWTGEA